MNQLLLLTKNNITETMSYSNWKKEIPLYLTNYINSLESKMKKGSQSKINLTRSIYGTTAYDVTESKMASKVIEFYNSQSIQDMQFELNNLEKEMSAIPQRTHSVLHNFGLSTKGVCYR